MNEELTNFLSEKRLDKGPWQAFERGIARMLSHAGFKDVKVNESVDFQKLYEMKRVQ